MQSFLIEKEIIWIRGIGSRFKVGGGDEAPPWLAPSEKFFENWRLYILGNGYFRVLFEWLVNSLIQPYRLITSVWMHDILKRFLPPWKIIRNPWHLSNHDCICNRYFAGLILSIRAYIRTRMYAWKIKAPVKWGGALPPSDKSDGA